MAGLSITSIFEGGSYLALVGGAAMAMMSRLPRETIQNQAALIEALNGRIVSLEASVKENRDALLEATRVMGILQGQVEVYKTLPLTSMAASMEAIATSFGDTEARDVAQG
jgi:hypothetical protein